MSELKSKFMVESIPLPEYPRPQMARKRWQNLNGIWDYAILSAENAVQPAAWDGSILVPFCVESALSGVQKAVRPTDTLWYHRRFSIVDFCAEKRTLLQFGAVDYACTVFVNGMKVGAHVGGYCPFTIDITAAVTDGENELSVAVTDATDTGDAPRGKQVLSPKGIWYTAVTGIWQTVWLEQVPAVSISGLHITPALEHVSFTVSLRDSAEGASATSNTSIYISVYEGDEKTAIQTLETTANTVSAVSIPNPKHWTPETPFLYRVTVSTDHDVVESYFGLRTFSMARDADGLMRLTLNGKPYFQKGLLDQGYWPDGLYTAPTDAALQSDIALAKRLGFNMLRKHIKVEPARWYYYCDKMGMLVWQDMPSGAAYPGDWLAVALPNLGIQVKDGNYRRFRRENAAGRKAFCEELSEMLHALYNAVSLCTWVPFNEGWGQFDANAAVALIRAQDDTRLIDAASGWHDQGGGDMLSLHKYIFKIHAPKQTGMRAFVLSEYGGYSQIQSGHVWDEAKSFGYRMYADKTALTAAFTRLHEQQVIPLIPKGLAATVYTQLTDVELEVNGLITYDREVCKLEEAAVRCINERLTLSNP